MTTQQPHTPDDPAQLADALEVALKQALAPLVRRIRELETSTADLAAIRETIAHLESFKRAFDAGAEPTE